MKRRSMRQVVPAIIMAGAAAVPVATTAEILSHATGGSGAGALQPSAPIAALPSRPSSSAGGSSLPASTGGAQTYQGPVVNQPYGGVQATITVAGKKITNVGISAPQDNPRSAGINQQAVPLLRSETLQAQSAQVNTVSGATYTSQAYAQSLQAALDQARRQGNAPAGSTRASPAGNGGSTTQPKVRSVSVPEDD